MNRVWLLAAALALLGAGCGPSSYARPSPDRRGAIPAGARKVSVAEDEHPPRLHSDEWEKPIPLPGPVNTAGAEDSPFVTADGRELYFFFTPDPGVPPERQLTDGVTGIWRAERTAEGWSEPERVFLSPPGEDALDGCEFVRGDTMWFCSARRGNFRGIDLYTAERKDGSWTDTRNAGGQLNKEYGAGEMHLSADGRRLYFHSDRAGGRGKKDIWLTERGNDGWKEPVNVEAVNTAEDEGWPALSPDEAEFWFLRWYQGSPGIFRSGKKSDGSWGKPELIVSSFAGEPSIDPEGNLYFTHHYYRDGKMLEADIYFAEKRR